MSDDPPVGSEASEPADKRPEDPRLTETRKLLASVEELRALLAPLTPSERERVLELARWLKEHPEP